MRGIGSGTLHHTCLLVRDLEKTARSLSGSLSIGPWSVWTIAPDECTVRGKNTRFSCRVALAQLGGASFELLEPVSGDSVYVEHLSTKGEGLHHTCLAYATRDEMRAACAELLGQGRELIQSGRHGDAFEFAYFEIAETGSILELLHIASLPPPELTIG